MDEMATQSVNYRQTTLFCRQTALIVVKNTSCFYTGFVSIKANTLTNKSAIESKVNEGLTAHLNEGEEGVTVSALRPMGTADFHGKIFEVKTSGEYVANAIRVKIVKIRVNDIVVEPIQ